jgi:hypothetical protein
MNGVLSSRARPDVARQGPDDPKRFEWLPTLKQQASDLYQSANYWSSYARVFRSGAAQARSARFSAAAAGLSGAGRYPPRR